MVAITLDCVSFRTGLSSLVEKLPVYKQFHWTVCPLEPGYVAWLRNCLCKQFHWTVCPLEPRSEAWLRFCLCVL